MVKWIGRKLGRRWGVLALLALLGGYWLLPISGQVAVILDDRSQASLWPQMRLDSPSPGPGQKVALQVTDVVPWPHMLLTVDGQPANLEDGWDGPGGTWTWKWTFTPTEPGEIPAAGGTTVAFYHDCDTGCVERGRLIVGGKDAKPATATAPAGRGLPTKLGVVFADSSRDWHGRSGWDVELTYARLADRPYWGIDDLAARVYKATAKGLRVLVRVDYDQGQSLPPANDNVALGEYLRYLQRLARDDRLRDVYGYVIGSGFNALDSSTATDRPVTATWYARLFNGYGEAVSRTDNVVQTIRGENAQVRVLVGPVRPWIRDQSGERPYTVDAPWLHYMNSLVASLSEATLAKAAVGVPMAGPDGFAIQAPGRVNASYLGGRDGAEEPLMDLQRSDWGGAQAGFRVYKDWLAVINSHTTTKGLPVYITSSNTFAPDDGTPPAQNYPKGWLTNALQVVNNEPQIQALIWFLDGPSGDRQWESFNLSRRSGLLVDADEEFHALLQRWR